MIKKIEIEGFRCFYDFTMYNIAPVTIIGGMNNAGKSSLLEAMYIPLAIKNPSVFWYLLFLRRDSNMATKSAKQIWNPLFYNLDETVCFFINVTEEFNQRYEFSLWKEYGEIKKIGTKNAMQVIKNNNDDYNNYKYFSEIWLKLKYHEYIAKARYFLIETMPTNENELKFEYDNDAYESLYMNGNVILYKNLMSGINVPESISKIGLNKKKKDIMIKSLQKFDKNIIDLTTIIDKGTPYIYVMFESGKSLPINYLGDGINKSLEILTCIINLENGILLIDEFENGLYYELYDELLEIMFETASSVNCQLIITTHNRDIIESALTVMEKLDKIDDICYQRLDKDEKGNIVAHPFQGKDLKIPFELNMEIR